MTAKATPTDLLHTQASIASIVGAQPPVLPGESLQEYEQALQSLVDELQAKTPMQVYLAQKMFDCIWWMRQYESLKRGIRLSNWLARSSTTREMKRTRENSYSDT